ncbi:NAD(P)H-dependent oxidoreductase [Candidatus Leptofilum sp.]|uniref:NAD(P)H-dependent oxidoreductase n=1 Tax=Candidatus Leptofilum sp. TaxID=3241576 RepID=UPI003B59CF41
MLYQELKQRAAAGNPIRVAASGAGWMGSGFAAQMAHVPGMELSVLIDPDLEAACDAFLATGLAKNDIVEATAVGQAMDAICQGKRVITTNVNLAAQLEAIDVMTDVTPSPASGADTAYAAIQHGKDVVLINIEADVTVGRMLKKLAADAGVLYSVSSGDEPGCLMELVEYVNLLGFEPIVIGKGKNNPLNPAATPDTVAESAKKANKDAYQTASYVDGSKTMFEMTCAANATGCVPMQRGMVGPEATQETITEIFSLKEDGGLAPHPGVVDFVQGSSMAGGVFVTVRVQDDRIADDLKYLKVGNGRYSTFFRPYHLWFIEAPISIAKAVLHRQTTLVPLDEPVADVLTIAKRDLNPGDRLDDFGGYTFRGLMDTATAVVNENGLPEGLAPGAEIIRPVASGSVITWDDVRLDETSTVVKLRRQQDQLK